MAYDALGNYIPDDEPSLDQMRMALAQKQSPAVSQIPGYDRPVPAPTPTHARPLDHVPETFKKLASNYNPLMMQLMMRDVGKIGANMASPFVGAYAGAMGNVQAKGAELMHGALGDEASAQEARDRMVRPDAPEQAAKFYQQPQTPAMQNFEEGLGTAFGALHLPAAGPGSGMPGHSPLSPRPMLTPNDVRVMGAEATRMGRQVRDIPTDFTNAQSGLQRIDPITGQPTYGAKLQGVAQDIGDITAGRTAEGKSLIPGVPDILMPETSMYAVRPKGSRLISPTRTSSDPNYHYPRDPVGSILRDEFAKPYSTEVEPSELLGIAESTQAQMPNARATKLAFDNYLNTRVQQMFPDAPDAPDAREAFDAKYSDPESKARMQLVMLNDFLTQTPEGQASGMPVPVELEKRHLAAMKWLTGPFSNYIERNVGTEGDPLVKLASEGLTMTPPEELKQIQRDRYSDAESNRVAGGYPVGGSFEKLLDAKSRDLRNTRQELADLETRRSELATAARAQGLEDPASLPEYAAMTNPLRAKAAARDKLQKEFENLELGAMYEDVTDAAVNPRTAALAQKFDYARQQFYPTLMQTPKDAMVYHGSFGAMKEAGLKDVAGKFYDDVMSGKIPLDKVEKTTVENFVRGKAQERIKTEAEKKVKEAQYIATAENNLRTTLQRDVPNSMTFGNAGVIELTKDTPVDVATARVSEDTAFLDHCVGQGGSPARDKVNIFTGKRQQYEPIIDPITGQSNPNAGGASTSYIRGLYEGNQLASVRSLETGRPVATLQFEMSHLGNDGQQRYRIGYASGFQNGAVDPVYAPAVRDYLNSRADSISGIGNNLSDHVGVYDATSPNDLHALARKTRLDKAQVASVLDTLPRFVLSEDITKAYEAGATSVPAVATTAPAVITPGDTTALRESMDTALSNAIDFVDTDRVGDALDSVVQGRIGEFLDGVRAEDLHDALLNFREALRNDEATFVNGHSEFNNALGEGLGEYLTDLDGIIDYHERRAREREAPVAAPIDPLANLFDDLEPEPNHPANLPAPVQALAPAIDFPGILDRVIYNLSQTEGVDIAEPVETVAARVAENVNPRLDPTGYATAIREAADAQPSHIVELALYDFADQIETAADRGMPASQRLANELLNMGRNPDGTLNRPDLLDTAHALASGELDHPSFTHIPPGPERAEAMDPVAQHFNRLVAAELQRPAPVATLQQMTRQELIQNIEPNRWMVINDRSDRATIMARGAADPATYVGNIRQGAADIVDGLNMYEREIVARDVVDALQVQGALQAPAPAAQPANLADVFRIPRDVRNASMPDLVESLDPASQGDVSALFDTLTNVNDREDLPRISYLIRNHRIGEWEGFDDTQRELLARLIEQHHEQAPRPGEGHAHGGPVRGYQSGGSVAKPEVKTPWLLSVPDYSRSVAREMYPGQYGQDDQHDAARHMLAAGTLSRKYGPTAALLMGKAHEVATSPIQAAKSLFGGQMPPDYAMDTHNNEVGSQLGQRAKSQADLEDLVQSAAERASRTQIPGQAFIRKSNGGTVAQMPNLDEMQYQLMMRRK